MHDSDQLLRHEALHTANIASDFFDRHLLAQPYIQSDPDLAKAASAISDRLGDFYQMIGQKAGSE